MPLGVAFQDSGEYVDDQSAIGRSSRVSLVDAGNSQIWDFDCARLPFVVGQAAPSRESVGKDSAQYLGVAGVLVSQKSAAGGQAVDALASRSAFSLARSLVGNGAEELALGVFSPPLVPVVGGDGNELVAGETDDLGVGEDERTARDAVVSRAAEGVSVHFPQQDGLAFRGSQPPCLPQAGSPGNRQPGFVAVARRDQLVQRRERFRRQRLNGTRERRETEPKDGQGPCRSRAYEHGEPLQVGWYSWRV
jgi:hypothetical protein